MKILFAILILPFISSCATADSWLPPKPQTVSSPNGEYLLRAIPPTRLDNDDKKSTKMLCIVYQLNTETQDYYESSRFNIEGNPIELFINDAGDRIVTLDQYFGIGQGPRVVVVYSTKGRELKKWGLKDFYDKEKIDNLPETTLSVLWRGRAGWTTDQKGIMISKAVKFNDSIIHFDDYFVDIRKLKITKWEPARIPGIKIVEQAADGNPH